VNAPAGGYVVMPDSPPPGETHSAAIQPDPVELGFWDLYDHNSQVTIRGQVTQIAWTNPNTYIYVTASGGVHWAVETSFTQFRQATVNPAIRIGQTISVSGYMPKDDPDSPLPRKISPAIRSYLKDKHLMRAGDIDTEYGQKLRMGRPLTDEELAERTRKCASHGC
jgi:hypothetical protein